ncbi:MAG TPA: PAS domain S-box protein, partial [Terriglobales bacterium]
MLFYKALKVRPQLPLSNPSSQPSPVLSDWRIERALESMSDAFLLLDHDWRIVYANREAARINSIAPEEIVGRTHWEQWPSSIGTEVEHRYRLAMATSEAQHFEHHYEPLDLWLEVHAYPTAEGLAIYFRDVTPRKQAEQALAAKAQEARRVERIYRAALSNTPDLVYVFGLDHRFIYANEALLTMWGRRWDEAIGKNCLELGYPDWHAAMHDREIEQVVLIRKSIRGQVPFTGTHGRRIYEYIFVPVIGEDGEVEAVAGTTRDVTEREMAEQAARAERATLAGLFQQAPAFIAVLRGPDHVFELVNPLYSELVGHRDVLGRSVREAIPEAETQGYLSLLDGVFKSGKPFVAHETPFDIVKNGKAERRYLNFVYQPMRTSEQEITGIIVLGVDVTSNQEAIEAKEWLAAIVESSDDAIVSKSLEGIIQSWNSGAERIFGYTAAEAIGKSITILIPEERLPEETEILSRLRAGQRIDHFQTVRQRKDGTKIEISLTVSPIRNAEGKVIGASKVARDITAQKLAEEALRNSEKLAAAGRLAASISHEINNPLEAVTNLLYLIAEGDLDPRGREYLRLADQELRRVSHMTTHTLRFHRQSTSASEVDLASLVDSVLVLHEGRIRNGRVKVERRYHRARPVYAFESELRQVIANLVSNAVDAMAM